MLGKLFKHEFKDTGKVLLPLNLALIGMTLIGMIIIGLKVFNTDNVAVGLALGSLILFYVLGIVALFIITYIYLMMRFYRSMYASEGYLTHTLPVSSFAILNTKILVSAFWAFLTMLLTIVSILALVFTGLKTTGETIDIRYIAHMMEVEMNYPLSSFIGWILLMMVLACFSGLLMIYCSISIGQLFNKYKVLAAIVTYGIIYIILQIIGTIMTIGNSMNQVYLIDANSAYTASSGFLSYFSNVFTSSIIQSLIMIVIFYAATAYICNKKLNLD